jgi:hypothetical protein
MILIIETKIEYELLFDPLINNNKIFLFYLILVYHELKLVANYLKFHQ